MQRRSSGGEAGARKPVAAIPLSPMRAALPFAPVTGFSFVKNKPRTVGAAPAKKPPPFVIAAATTSAVGKQPRGGASEAKAAPFSLANKFAVGAGGLKFGFPPAKAHTQQRAQPAAQRPTPKARGGVVYDSSAKTGAVGGSGGGLLPQTFSWNGFKGGPQKPTAFSKPTAGARSKTSHGNSTPTAPRKIPLIPTLMTPTRSPDVVNAAAGTSTASVNFIKPGSACKKRAPPSVVQPSLDAFRSAKRPKQAEVFGACKSKHSPPTPDGNKLRRSLPMFQPLQSDRTMDCHLDSIDTAMVTRPTPSPSTAWDFSCPDDAMDDSAAAAASPLDISSEIVLLPLSLTDIEDEDFYDRVKKMHAQLEQTRREQEEAHDRLLQSHAELSESLLDAITDLVAESGGCGLDQLSTDDGPVDDSVVTDTPDLRALRYVTG